ncbi:hypothetical protein VMCG_06469 [Cytospora schulzeri]|uniref:Uncharacterized protein n=1 Tax=Cytospora schulzeri TaxID=448051 RepID=A0A423WBH1_9PEZI|nr:hypothetical protein VMCG_06469 [Valsa malicola]
MATCQITGHPDAYGLGIRTAFYLQWFGVIATSWLLESDALNLRFVNALTIAATTVGLALNLDSLQPCEIYIVLLLVCGTLYFTIPVYIWRLATCCHPWWDPDRWPRVRVRWLLKVSMMFMSGALVGLQLWFWCTGVHNRPVMGVDDSRGPDADCVQYGFLFGRFLLDNPGLIATNIIVHLAILLIGTWNFASYIGIFDDCSISENRAISLQQLRTVCDTSVSIAVTLAIELVISWNNIQGVNDLHSAAQLIPPVISGAYLLRSFYVWLSGPEEGTEGINLPHSPGGSGGSGSRITSSNGGGPTRRRRKSMVYTGSAGHRRRHRPRRTTRKSPNMAGDPPDTAYASPMPMSISTDLPSLSGSADSGQYNMTPPVEDVAADELYHDDHVYDEESPPSMCPIPPDDDLGYLPPEPPPTATSIHGGCPYHSMSEESSLPSVGGYFPPLTPLHDPI